MHNQNDRSERNSFVSSGMTAINKVNDILISLALIL